ncbi:hypothetical protein PG993_010852 [Apiospora rasikravindrae]|uniref:Secreted protein n=1 Tax=Apiospora rasikravindrae TaxID=990691 RepID=A0ABR1SCH5_9PEZI
MKYSTSFAAAATAVMASFVAPAAALFDGKACNGIGACTAPSECNYWPNGEPQQPEWDCGSAGTINGQVAAGAELNFEKGLTAGTVVAAADFPARCNLMQPGDNATLLKATYQDVTVYGWIEYSCTETTKITNACYSSTPNPSKTFTCKVLKNGQECKSISGSVVNKDACRK